MKKFIDWFLSLFRTVPAEKNLKEKVLSLYPDAVVAEDLLPGSQVDVSVVVLPGVPAGFPDSLASLVRSGDGVLTVVITGGAADFLAKALGLESFVPDSVRAYLISLLKSSGIAARIAALASNGRGAVVVGVLEAVSPFIVNALESALGGFNGCVTVR